MSDPSPIDPIAVLQSLIAAWNRGQSGTDQMETTPHLKSARSDEANRFTQIEARLALLEAAVTLLAEDRGRSGKRKKARKD